MRKLCYLITAIGVVLMAACSDIQENQQITETQYTNLDTLQLLINLPSNVDESSGLSFWNEGIWTHNDSGGEPELYHVSSTDPQLLATIGIDSAKAKDWEELARDSSHIYIGDFGNNKGNRKDLRIYKVPLGDLIDSVGTSATAGKIEFTYPDQTNFKKRAYQHNFDCEAMIAVGDSLYLFSKNHQDERCRLYRLPKTPGQHTATLISEMDTDGLITAADIDPENKIVVLLGYNVYQKMGKYRDKPFVWLLHDFPGNSFFEGRSVRINLAEERQTEGVCFGREGQLIISSEGEGKASGGLYSLNYRKWLK